MIAAPIRQTAPPMTSQRSGVVFSTSAIHALAKGRGRVLAKLAAEKAEAAKKDK